MEINTSPAPSGNLYNGTSFQSLIDRITDAFVAIDKNWNYIFVNQQAARMAHREISEMVGRNIWIEFPELLDSSTYPLLQEAMKTQCPASNIDYYAPLDLWFENHVYPSADGVSVFVKDITERKKLELMLANQIQQEKILIASATLKAQEKERNAIGVELHDNVNQILIATKLLMTEILKFPARLNEILPQCLKGIDNAIAENRKIAGNLISPDMTIEKLTDQVRHLKKTMLQAAGMRVVFLVKGFDERKLSPEQKLAVYRILQEQSSNIIKHSRAATVTISLHTDSEQFSLCIDDDGIGAEKHKSHDGNGLRNIAERVSVLKGDISIKTSPGKGFAMEIRFPLSLGYSVPVDDL